MPYTHILTWLAAAAVVHAHTWVEQMQEISSNGSFTGAMGYPRGYVSRTETGFNGNSDDYLLPPLTSGRTRINGSDLLCHPAQRVANQTDGYPMLTTSPGNFIAMKYLENGHVTLPQNQPGKPPAAGSVYIFGTTAPIDDEKLTDVLQWTSNGSGGDGRGRLITAQNFDDGRCHQINGGALSIQRQQEFPDRVPGQPTSNVEQWCEADVPIPTDQTSGTLTLYFVWDWPTRPGEPGIPDGKDEYYTSCADVKIVPASANTASAASAEESSDANALIQQDPQTRAVETYSARSAFKMNPLASYALSGTGYASGYGAYATAASSAAAETITSAYSSSSQATNAVASSSPQTTSVAYTTSAQSTSSSCSGLLSYSVSIPTVRYNASYTASPTASDTASDDIVWVTAYVTTTVTPESTLTSTVTDMATVLATVTAPSALTPKISFTTIVSTTVVPGPGSTMTASPVAQSQQSYGGSVMSFAPIDNSTDVKRGGAEAVVEYRRGRRGGHLARRRWY